jgi:hypothetical protein
MNREKLYTSKNMDIEFDAQENFMYVNWKGFQSVENVKSGCEKMLEFLKQKNISRVLNDNRLVTGPWQGAAEWAAKEWFPRMFASGMTHFAWIQSTSVFSQLSAEKALSETDESWKTQGIRTFDDPELARKWVLAH